MCIYIYIYIYIHTHTIIHSIRSSLADQRERLCGGHRLLKRCACRISEMATTMMNTLRVYPSLRCLL